MLNVSRMPTIRLGSHRLMRVLNPCDSQSNKLGESVEQGKVGSSHVGLPNMKIYLDQSLLDLKRGNLKFGGSRGKIIFY